MKVVCLIENTEGTAGCGIEHGLCLYVETEQHKLLLDTGRSCTGFSCRLQKYSICSATRILPIMLIQQKNRGL